jgi:hypothetical protein
MELRVRRERKIFVDKEFLYAEWLLLQNPLKQFSTERPRLPGQKHPGLGLLAEIVALMVLMCEQVGLEGIVFVPAHYYMAALGRRHLKFVRPEDARIYAAISRAVSELSLAEATRAIEAGRVVHATDNSPVKWHTPLMILPVNEELQERLSAVDETCNSLPHYILTGDQ